LPENLLLAERKTKLGLVFLSLHGRKFRINVELLIIEDKHRKTKIGKKLEVGRKMSEKLLQEIIEKLDNLTGDVSCLKQDVSCLKQDVSGLKQGQQRLETEIQQLRQESKGRYEYLINCLEKVNDTLEDIREDTNRNIIRTLQHDNFLRKIKKNFADK